MENEKNQHYTTENKFVKNPELTTVTLTSTIIISFRFVNFVSENSELNHVKL